MNQVQRLKEALEARPETPAYWQIQELLGDARLEDAVDLALADLTMLGFEVAERRREKQLFYDLFRQGAYVSFEGAWHSTLMNREVRCENETLRRWQRGLEGIAWAEAGKSWLEDELRYNLRNESDLAYLHKEVLPALEKSGHETLVELARVVRGRLGLFALGNGVELCDEALEQRLDALEEDTGALVALAKALGLDPFGDDGVQIEVETTRRGYFDSEDTPLGWILEEMDRYYLRLFEEAYLQELSNDELNWLVEDYPELVEEVIQDALAAAA